MKLTFPEDIGIASFEGFGDTVFEYLVWPPITANDHPTREMAFAAMDLLMEEIRGNRLEKRGVSKDVILNTRLITTDSSKRLEKNGGALPQQQGGLSKISTGKMTK